MPLVGRPDGGVLSGVGNLKKKEHRHWLVTNSHMPGGMRQSERNTDIGYNFQVQK